MRRETDWPNFHHLRYFWTVVRCGTISKAARELKLTPQTISSQLRDLESALGEELFTRAGHRLSLTERGELVFSYAEKIFDLGRELVESLRGANRRELNLRVGLSIALPKLVAHHLLEPAFHLDRSLRLVCHEAKNERLFSDLVVHDIDVVLADSPVPSSFRARAYSHLLGECGVSFLAGRPLAESLRADFPSSLNHAPVLLPIEGTALRDSLSQWLKKLGIQPEIVAEVDDIALVKTFGQSGRGVFIVPQVIESEVRRQYQVELVGRTDEIVERFYAISVERKVRHPAVVAICEQARFGLFSASQQLAEP